MDDLLVADIENGSRTEATGMARWTITESRRIVDVKPVFIPPDRLVIVIIFSSKADAWSGVESSAFLRADDSSLCLVVRQASDHRRG